jgi:glycosyltransferase involved in cell wall biosynthesis
LLAQTYQDYEIILIDDNPPEERVAADPTLIPLLEHAKLRLLVHENPRNAASARNVGLRAAHGKWITYLDDDDSYQPTKLQKQWERAKQTNLPLGLCGVTYHAGGRRRQRQVSKMELGKSEALLLFPALPTLFHRNSGTNFFDEKLFASEDAYFFCQLVEDLKIDRIFNVAESLVDVYPQPSARVNTNAEATWKAAQAIYRDFAPAYGASMAEVFLAQARLGYWKLQKGGFREMFKLSSVLLRLRGWKDARFILNCFAFKIPWLRRLLVS